ncbi:NAD(P)H-dependent glycerol-3-phosphate dehydrogenase [Pseudoprimorskyibacter insulae]|uniref:Glycerol-3-phosphate dehydrogenase [NAD(P)+] n=1 Tax=Pseudoprimorskyibacter insulae TaxID=1695997 RepID=A0A2R8AYM8_9RHOB|nr:NAD(P)H-dependent glycerol-3-phosphate dehydrogenase [Pseudoprimorskyibacter insulae]SPF81145.1 Glycerol-3-phosphate dehydrogenase [NAD(P)+] [Pseudoprimorskyibacter insulae]
MISVLGAGAFGTALAVVLAQSGKDVTLWARSPEAVEAINVTRQTSRLPGVTLPAKITATSDLNHAASAPVVLVATPTQTLRAVLSQITAPMTGTRIVLCCKGIDVETGMGVAETTAHLKPGAIPAILTGPSFATDIAQGLPTALTLACADPEVGKALQLDLATPSLRLYRTTDTIGAELGGALKNVIAIACGACIGEGMGESARAALMTRGFAEMTRLAMHFGADPRTLTGMSGLGDLMLTCTSEKSRNYRHGLALGRQDPVDRTATVEGVKTAEAVTRLSKRLGVDMPISEIVFEVTTENCSVAEAITALLNRSLKEE